MTGNQREWDTQGWGRERAQSASRGQEPEKELVECGNVWEQPLQWLCQGVVSYDPALLSHLGHRVLRKPYRKRDHNMTKGSSWAVCNRQTDLLTSRSELSGNILTHRENWKITVWNGQLKKNQNCKPDINSDLCGERQSTSYFSTELSTPYGRQKSHTEFQGLQKSQ